MAKGSSVDISENSQPVNSIHTFFATILIPEQPARTVQKPYISAGSKPCDDCTPSSGEWRWSEASVFISLSAPTCGGHIVGRPFPEVPYFCGGGGTHAEFEGMPVFRMKLRNAAAE